MTDDYDAELEYTATFESGDTEGKACEYNSDWSHQQIIEEIQADIDCTADAFRDDFEGYGEVVKIEYTLEDGTEREWTPTP